MFKLFIKFIKILTIACIIGVGIRIIEVFFLKQENNRNDVAIEEISSNIEGNVTNNDIAEIFNNTIEEVQVTNNNAEEVTTNVNEKSETIAKPKETTIELQEKTETKKEEIVSKEETKKEESNIEEEPILQETETKIETEEKIEQNKEQEKQKEQETKVDLSKYDRYYNGLNGGYICFKKNPEEIAKLKKLLEESIKEFGYTNITLVEDSSIISDRYFTANKTNAQNVVYNAEYFTIHYYAETEYHVRADGTESIFQIRSYTKITGQ